ncbi:MAG: AbgT family transporter [Myxococcales bacterium]|nr:AbgT family transporter [Myxococcales bacterium]
MNDRSRGAGLQARLLDGIELIGNRLPHPFWLFLWLIVAVAVVSEVVAALVSDSTAFSGDTAPRPVLRPDTLRWFVLHMVENFGHFEPLALVLVMLMGVSIAEGTGLIPAVMRGIAASVPKTLIVPALFGLAACGNIGSDAGIVVIPPLAAIVFKELGRNPIAGLLVGYVGATAGFTANLLPAGTDVLAMALTNAATRGEPEITVLANWYFMSASVVLLSAIGTFVTVAIVEPRLPPGPASSGVKMSGLAPEERRGVVVAGVVTAILSIAWLATVVPEGGALRDPNPDQFWRSPFFRGLVPVLFSLFAASGIAYGIAAKTIGKPNDILEHMIGAMRRMAPYIVLILAISQFIELFQYTRLDQLIARSGASLLSGLGAKDAPIPLFLAFISAVAFSNMFLGSASAKWAIFAPIFVPMFCNSAFIPRSLNCCIESVIPSPIA